MSITAQESLSCSQPGLARREQVKGVIFDIKHYSIHDGPGIRTTVFFKGCPLHCLWCHNPESIDRSPELMPRPNLCSVDCFACVEACPEKALSKDSGPVRINRGACTLCGICADVCMYQALEMAGREMTQAEVLKEVEKDRLFFEESGGGVTFSGGESLAQPEFLEALLDELRSRNIHTAIDTSGLAAPGLMEKMAFKSDLILYDLKMMNEERHKKYTGVSNRLILDNLKRLAGLKRKIWIRIPLIAGVNDDDENILETAVFLKSLGGITNIGLLPYHKGGCEKIKRLGKEDPFQCFESPSAERMENIRKYLADSGFIVKIGG